MIIQEIREKNPTLNRLSVWDLWLITEIQKGGMREVKHQLKRHLRVYYPCDMFGPLIDEINSLGEKILSKDDLKFWI